jgi:hypothetical protein
MTITVNTKRTIKRSCSQSQQPRPRYDQSIAPQFRTTSDKANVNSYHEELNEVIDCTTSADNTETETEGTEKPRGRSKGKSILPWANHPEANTSDSKLNNFFSSLASSSGGEDSKSTKKLQKKRRPREKENYINVASETDSHTQKSPDSEISHSEVDLGRLSPHQWTHQPNISQSSLTRSDLSRHSHISSNRSSVEVARSPTPVERAPVHRPPTTFEAIQYNLVTDSTDDLPTRIIVPAALEDKPRAGSHSSNHSAESSGKGSKIGAWLRKKRGHSVSSQASAGGGSIAVVD